MRIGCWNYGGPGWLQSILSVDGVSYNLDANTVDTLYEFVGFEKVNENDNNVVTDPKPDITDIAGLDDPSSLLAPYNVGPLVTMHDGYWPENMGGRQGIIWVDFDFGKVLGLLISLFIFMLQ